VTIETFLKDNCLKICIVIYCSVAFCQLFFKDESEVETKIHNSYSIVATVNDRLLRTYRKRRSTSYYGEVGDVPESAVKLQQNVGDESCPVTSL